jgi:hypothetical protein
MRPCDARRLARRAATMSQQSVIEELQHLGMSGYEAKAYVALVAAGSPLNGYEVAKHSGVPRSTVYETLGKLVGRGAAYEVRAGEASVGYISLPPNALLDRSAPRVRPLDRHAALRAARGRLPTAGPPGAQPLRPGVAAGQSRGRGRSGAQRPVPLGMAAGDRAAQTAGAPGRRRGRRRLGGLLRRRPRARSATPSRTSSPSPRSCWRTSAAGSWWSPRTGSRP